MVWIVVVGPTTRSLSRTFVDRGAVSSVSDVARSCAWRASTRSSACQAASSSHGEGCVERTSTLYAPPVTPIAPVCACCTNSTTNVGSTVVSDPPDARAAEMQSPRYRHSVRLEALAHVRFAELGSSHACTASAHRFQSTKMQSKCQSRQTQASESSAIADRVRCETTYGLLRRLAVLRPSLAVRRLASGRCTTLTEAATAAPLALELPFALPLSPSASLAAADPSSALCLGVGSKQRLHGRRVALNALELAERIT